MNEELEQSAAQNAETQLEAEVKSSVNGESSAPEKVETDEEKNARIAAEAAEKARLKEERRQQSVQRRFDELTADKYAERKRADQLAEQNAKILALLEGRTQGSAAQVSGEPTREQFTDYEDFVTARAEYRAEQKALALIEQHTRKQQEEAQRTTQEQTRAQSEKAFVERRMAIEKELPDYREVVEDWEPKLPDSVVDLIVRMPEGPLITYHMAKNPALEAQFREQPSYMHGVLLGQLVATLKSPAKAVSAAPAPGKPVGSKVTASSNGGYTGDPEGYYEWARKNLR